MCPHMNTATRKMGYIVFKTKQNKKDVYHQSAFCFVLLRMMFWGCGRVESLITYNCFVCIYENKAKYKI